MRTLWFNDSLVEAVDDPRVHHQLFPPEIQVDPGFPKVDGQSLLCYNCPASITTATDSC